MFDRLWRCKDGRTMRVSQMDNQHLRNAIAMIKRSKSNWRRGYLSRLELEVEIRKLGLRS